jgi:hypothetical protein
MYIECIATFLIGEKEAAMPYKEITVSVYCHLKK